MGAKATGPPLAKHPMSSFSIPISVKRRSQRTLKLVAFGFKTKFTTKVPGKLVVRKKTAPVDAALAGVQPYKAAPPKPDPTATPSAVVRKPEVSHQTYFPDQGDPKEIHKTLVSAGIKVRDFAYPANRVGHTTPVHVQPLTAVQAPDESTLGSTQTGENVACAVEESPMPSVSLTWTEPHPCLRPIPKEKWPGEPKIPTPDEPYIPVYDTHRIPGWFDQALGLMEVEYRLSQDPRTMPISGMVTRRLLSLSPNLVDLSRYHEMDLEELRRYDRAIVWRLKLGIEPYPWRAMHNPHWVPSSANLDLMRARGLPIRAQDDKFQHRVHLSTVQAQVQALACREEDELKKHRLANLRRYEETGELNPQGADAYDRVGHEWVTYRQRVTVFAKYKHGLLVDDRWVENQELLEEVQGYDQYKEALARGADPNDLDVDMADPLPLAPWLVPQYWATDLPFFPIWGPEAPWTGYQLLSGTPTGKTVHEYAAELSKCTEAERPWPVVPAPTKPREYAIHVGMGDFFNYRSAKGRLTAVLPGEDSDEDGGDDESESESESDDEDSQPGQSSPHAASEPGTPARKRRIEEVEPETVKGDVAENVDTPPPMKRVKVW